MAFGVGSSSPFSIFSTPQQPFYTPQQQQQPIQSGFLFATPQQQQQQQPQQPPQQQQIHLLTTEKTPVSSHTKWADLHPDSQKLLLQVEERILEYRDESRRLDQCERLFNPVYVNEGFEIDATRISQELGGITTAMEREKVSLQELMKSAKEMMRNAEVAVRSFIMLRSRFSRAVAPALGSTTVSTANPSVGTAAGGLSQSMAPTLPIVDFYSGVPSKPSPFLLQTVTRFENRLQEYRQWIEKLERLLFAESEENNDSSQLTLLQSLPTVITNIYDFFIYVAAKAETLHQHIGSMRAAYLADQRRRGEDNNPFLEADRREVAKREAAARRVHPTLQASILNQASMQPVGILTSTATSAASFSAPQNATSSTPSGSSSYPVFGTASSLTSSSSAFGTPSTTGPTLSVFNSSAASSSSLFGFSGTPTTPSLFASGTSSSIFGSGPAIASAASPSGGLLTPMTSGALFGSSASPSGTFFSGGQTSGSIFGATNVLSTGASVFGIGTTQGTTTSKAKTRTTRRK